MRITTLVLLTSFVVNISNVALAAEAKPAQPAAETVAPTSAEYNKIIEEYKTYLRTVAPTVMTEIKSYRGEISKLNAEKRKLYQTLSQESQLYLAKEQEFKKKLPAKTKGELKKIRQEIMDTIKTEQQKNVASSK